MIVLLGAVAGALTGTRIASKRGGSWADIAQYGTVYCIAFSLLGLVLTIVIEKNVF